MVSRLSNYNAYKADRKVIYSSLACLVLKLEDLRSMVSSNHRYFCNYMVKAKKPKVPTGFRSKMMMDSISSAASCHWASC
jgi:predicted lipoprotein